MNWQEIIEFLGGATVFGVVIAYLGKWAIEAYLSGRLEEYKGALQRATTEHSIRFQSLHAERAETIKTLYAHLVHAHDVLGSTLARFQIGTDMPLHDKVSALAQALNTLREYYLPRKIFLEPTVCNEVDKLLGIARTIFIDITTYEIDPQAFVYRHDGKLLMERMASWDSARKAHESDFVALKASLESKFRGMLGIAA